MQRLCNCCGSDECRLCFVEEGGNEGLQADQACSDDADVKLKSTPHEVAVVVKTVRVFKVIVKMVCLDCATCNRGESHAKGEKQAHFRAQVKLHA